MKMLASAKDSLERKLSATPRGKGYTTLANTEAELEDLSDSFYDEQLQSDGWHLDEVEDDEQLDFSLPPSRRAPPKCAGCCPTACVLL